MRRIDEECKTAEEKKAFKCKPDEGLGDGMSKVMYVRILEKIYG